MRKQIEERNRNGKGGRSQQWGGCKETIGAVKQKANLGEEKRDGARTLKRATNKSVPIEEE